MSRKRSSLLTLTDTFRDVKASYQLGEQSRFTSRVRGVDPMGSGADYHYADPCVFYGAIERARDYDRNNMIVGQGVDRLVDNVMQDGLKPDPETGSADLDQELSARWREWAGTPKLCDARKTLNFNRIAKLALRHVIVDGDVLVLPLAKLGALQCIEAHRVLTPYNTTKNVIHGVLVDEVTRAPKEFWVAPEGADLYRTISRVKDITKYRAFTDDGDPEVFHIFNPKRFSQTRGMSAFLPITLPLGIHDDLQIANLVKAQAAACVTILRERTPDFGGSARAPEGSQSESEFPDGTTRKNETMSMAMELIGEVGEKLTGYTPNIPNQEFFQHAAMILGIISVNLNMPVAVLLLDPTKTNFSGWRGAIDQARLGFRNIQEWMRSNLHAPVYHWKVSQWLAEDMALARMAKAKGVDAYAVKWKAPRWPYIEPMKDAQADAMRLEKCLSSDRRVAGDRGEDWDELVIEIPADRGALFESAILEARRLNGLYEEARVDWRELLHRTTPGSTGADAQQAEDDADESLAIAEERRAVG
jgi:lambda family phage portal protein